MGGGGTQRHELPDDSFEGECELVRGGWPMPTEAKHRAVGLLGPHTPEGGTELLQPFITVHQGERGRESGQTIANYGAVYALAVPPILAVLVRRHPRSQQRHDPRAPQRQEAGVVHQDLVDDGGQK